jgi:hypothetical protein
VVKILEDRSFKDTVSFKELREMAKRCREVPEDSQSEETYWLGKLRRSDYLVERSGSNSISDDINPIALAEMTGIVKYDFASRRNAQELDKAKAFIRFSSSDDVFFHSSEGKMTSEIPPHGDPATKRPNMEWWEHWHSSGGRTRSCV